MEVLIVMVAVSIIGLVIRSHVKQRRERETTLSVLANRLEGSYDESASAVWGTLDGTKVALRFVTHGSGSSAESWTEIEADIPDAYPMLVFVRRHAWRDRAKIERGEMVDVEVGDPAFDQEFLVEAAPAEIVKRLFVERVCAYLQTQGQLTLTTEDVGERRVVRLAIRGWLDEVITAMPAIQTTVLFAGRVREAFAAAEAETAPRATGAPYRPILDDQPARDAAANRAREVEHLAGVRAGRLGREKMMGLFAIVIIVAAVMLLMTR